MKLIVQIPCFNEEKTLPLVLKSVPKKIPGIDRIETLVIDDGSTDYTSQVAKKAGVTYILRHNANKGLAISFADGIAFCLNQGADIIVNTDADNQYPQKDIPELVKPILSGQSDIVIANRQTWKIRHFSQIKKFFQWFGSFILRKLTGSHVPDAVSGFRAYSREAALQLNIVTEFSYVIETIIAAQSKHFAISSINVETNPPTRPSRLFRNMFEHMRHSSSAIIRIYTMFRPLFVFSMIGGLTGIVGIVMGIRFVYFTVIGQGSGHVQSLILSAILITVGFQIIMTGLVADLIAINRTLLEQGLRKIKLLELRQLKQIRVPKIKRKR